MEERHAVVLTGDLGMGHHVITEVVSESLERLGWSTDILDCMSLLGPRAAKVGDWVFRHLTAVPSVYDGIHFAHFRPNSRLAATVDRMATARLVPALEDHLQARPAQLLFSAFATGASAIAKLTSPGGGSAGRVRPATVALCVDVAPHGLWVREGVDLFLVTSEAAAANVRRYLPGATITVLPPPVRRSFLEAPARQEARRRLGVPQDAPCVLLMGGGWGLGPLAETSEALARHQVFVLGVAGHNAAVADRLAELAGGDHHIVAFGFSEEIPTLMSAADLVVTTAGANTCAEARAMGRSLMLLDVVPGHGRENILHELEMGDAAIADPRPEVLVGGVLAALERTHHRRPAPAAGEGWAERLDRALGSIGQGSRGPGADAGPPRVGDDGREPPEDGRRALAMTTQEVLAP